MLMLSLLIYNRGILRESQIFEISMPPKYENQIQTIMVVWKQIIDYLIADYFSLVAGHSLIATSANR